MRDAIEAREEGGRSDNEGPNPYRWVLPAVSACALVLLGLLIAAAAYLFSQGEGQTERLLALGYPGVSIVMFFSSATVFLPAPGFATVLGAGASNQFNPYVLGLFAGLGSSVGELTGYLVGLGGRKALHTEARPWVRRGEYFMRRWGFLTVLTMASFPNPFFDAVGVLAGSLGYSPRRLWLACVIGNSVKYTAIALGGGTLAGLFLQLFSGQ